MSAMATLGTGPVAGIGRVSNRAGTSASRNQDASTSGRARDVIVPSRRDDGRVARLLRDYCDAHARDGGVHGESGRLSRDARPRG